MRSWPPAASTFDLADLVPDVNLVHFQCLCLRSRSCRLLQKEPPLVAEVREDGEPHAGVRRLSSAPFVTQQPVDRTLRPQVQEGQEELPLQVNRFPLFAHHKLNPQRNLSVAMFPLTPPFLPRRPIYIFWVFIARSSLKRLPLFCIYRAFNFQRHNRKCHLLPFDRFTHGVQKQANVNFTLYEKKGKPPDKPPQVDITPACAFTVSCDCLAGMLASSHPCVVSRSMLSVLIQQEQPTPAQPPLLLFNRSGGESCTHKHVDVYTEKLIVYSPSAKACAEESNTSEFTAKFTETPPGDI